MLVSAAGPPAGRVAFLCDRRWHAVVSLQRALGSDERPDLQVRWPACPLTERPRGRLGLLTGSYDPVAHRLDDPAYRAVSVPEAVRLAPEVGDLIAQEDARLSRTRIGTSLPDLVRPGVLPGPGGLDALLRQLAPGTRAEPVRPELLVTLAAVERRHPEIVRAAGDRVAAAVETVLERMDAGQRSAHAAEAAGAAWTVLGDRARAARLLDAWTPPAEPAAAHHLGADALALPTELVLERLSGLDPDSDTARAFAKRHLLDPLAADLDLASAVPLPAGFTVGLPRVEAAWAELAAPEAELRAVLAQFSDWTRIGRALVDLSAAAGVDRMPTAGPRPPDPRGVRAWLRVVCEARRALPLELGDPEVAWDGGRFRRVALRAGPPARLPALSALTIELGTLGNAALDPGARFEVGLDVRVGRASGRLRAGGTVGVSW